MSLTMSTVPAAAPPVQRANARRVALVTGGGGHIGSEICRGFARAGIAVAVADVNLATAQAVADEIAAADGDAMAVACDIGCRDSVAGAVREIGERLGGVDILVNNGAKFSELTYKPFEEIPFDEWSDVLHVNVTGTFHCIRAVSAGMKARGWGRIVNISSGSIRMGRPNFLHYVSSKSALIGMGRSLARELGPSGITVNTVLPGVALTDTQRKRLDQGYQDFILSNQCIPRPMPASALVGAILFLSSDDAAFVTGQQLSVDGGLTHG